MKTKTVVCIAPKQVVVKEEEVPDVQPGTFLVKAKLSAISTGTELTLVTSDSPPESVWARLANYPLKLGYSHLGEVVAVGEGVDNVKVGDKVVGWKNHSQFVLYRKGEFCMKVPDGVADEAAVLFALAIISLNGVRKAKIQLGESVAVFGLGPIGIWSAQFARLAGARPVIGVDLLPERREWAKKAGIDFVLDGKEDLVERISGLTKGRMVDVVFEVTGNPDAILDEVKVLRRQGRLVVLSSPRGKTLFDFHDWCNWTSISIIGAHVSSHPPHENPEDPWTRERNTELFFELVRKKEIVAAELVTHRFRADDAPSAYQLLMTERGKTGIVLLDWE